MDLEKEIRIMKDNGSSNEQISFFLCGEYKEERITLEKFKNNIKELCCDINDNFFELSYQEQKQFLINREVKKRVITGNLKIVQKYERAIQGFKSHKVQDEWIIRPLVMLFLNDHITMDDLCIRLSLLDYFINDDVLSSSTEEQKEYLRGIDIVTQKFDNYTSDLVWYCHMKEEEREEYGLVKEIIEFYKGYPPYAYNKEKELWYNIAFALEEKDFK